MKKIAIFGECMIEFKGQIFGDMTQYFGGDTLNSAYYLSCLGKGVSVNYVSALGNDGYSQAMLAAWQAEGINTDNVLIDEKRKPGIYMIQVDEQGERSFEYWRDQSAARFIFQHHDINRVITRLEDQDVFYFSGISIAILPDEDRIKFIELLQHLKSKGIKIAFDSNYRPALWKDLAETKQVYAKLLPFVDIALLTDDDEYTLWQENSPEQIITRTHQQGVELVLVKQGPVGCRYSINNGESNFVPTTPVTKVIDTTSAGDSFNAGFLSQYLNQASLTDACLYGHKIAAQVIQQQGAIVKVSP